MAEALPPYKRAHVLLQEMAGLTVRLLEIAGNKSWQGAHHKSLYPPVLAGAPVPPEGMAATSTKEILTMLDSHQSLLSDAVAEIAELQSLEQEKLRISEAVSVKDSAIRDFARRVRDAEQVLESTLEEFEEYRRPAKRRDVELGLGKINIEELVAYAHKISYTTFAPPDFTIGQPGALAPAPQEQQMRASQLYHFSDMDLGLMKAPSPPAAPPPAAAAPEAPKEDVVVIPGLPPGVKLPPMPEGWKPGDPVHLPEQAVAPAAPPSIPPAAAAPASSGVIQVPFVQLDLNPELEEDYTSDFSEDESSGDD